MGKNPIEATVEAEDGEILEGFYSDSPHITSGKPGFDKCHEHDWRPRRAKKKRSNGLREHLLLPTRSGTHLPLPGRTSLSIGHVSSSHVASAVVPPNASKSSPMLASCEREERGKEGEDAEAEGGEAERERRGEKRDHEAERPGGEDEAEWWRRRLC
ncbi:hypothetical protein NE237_002267 [Protea cynaroides]|uniref:Uncharacterized protein n=1 Tax=Protea cynaroides TaxID=273540 RepID=A0A9Q0KVK1_9MAGN|nr:hypothetical protein NE237_002267 [Protea cynaroides]